jgi:hypothetical protein
MFGNNSRRLRKLQEHDGVKANAKVIEAKRTHMAFTAGDPSIAANTEIIWKLTLQVMPDGQPSFEAKLEQRYGQFANPSAGDEVVVYYDSSDPSKVAIDDSASTVLEATVERMQARRAASGMNPRAVAYVNSLESAAIGDLNETTEAFKSDPHGAVVAAKERVRAAVAAAQVAGQVPGMSGIIFTPSAGAPAGPGDPIDKLKELADLRDRGVLTADEFEAQKRRVLGA